MSLDFSFFDNCSLSDLYVSILETCRKMDRHLNIMRENSTNSGKYIDAKASLYEWTLAFNSLVKVVLAKHGEPVLKDILDTIESEITLENQKRKLFCS